ncbi:MAG: NYN domain-containing protein [bacterium]|nr:NYN domain-containing protein [bacterium]
MNTSQRVGIFIDAQNLYHSAKHLHNARVNFAELVSVAANGRTVFRALAYVVKSEGIATTDAGSTNSPQVEPVGERLFFDALRNAGIELRLKDLQVFAGGAKKADWDVGLAVDAIRTAGAYDVAVLATGDGDFVPLIEYLRWGLGKQVEVISFGKATSGKLKEAADRFTDLDDVRRVLMQPGSRGAPRRRVPPVARNAVRPRREHRGAPLRQSSSPASTRRLGEAGEARPGGSRQR